MSRISPQLVAGPIERSSSLLPQIVKRRIRETGDFSEGLSLVMFGLFLKVVLADNLAFIANGAFSGSDEITGADALVGIYAFAFQIYGDFAGYSLIARGVSKWLGIDLMTNFRMPYLARNPSDFWNRWHISLSSWLRDYLYIPLGGNRGSTFKIYRNLMLTMLIGGLWHGAGWTFILWGATHGLLLCLYRPFGKKFLLPGAIGRVIATLLFFQFVCITWLLFRAESIEQVWHMLSLIVTDFRITDFSLYAAKLILFFAAPLMVYEIWLDRKHTTRRLEIAPWGWRAAVYCYIAFMLIEFPPTQHGQFIAGLEAFARYKAPTLDYDREHIHQFPQISDTLAKASSPPKKVLFFGNSLMMHGAKMETIQKSLDQENKATTAKMTPVGTAITDWTYLYKRYIESNNANPDILVLGFVRHHISDDEPIKPRRLARHFVAQNHLPQLWTQDLDNYHSRTQTTLSHYSALFGDQPTHQSGILYMICDEYSDGVSKNNRWVQEHAERQQAKKLKSNQNTPPEKPVHWRLQRFIKLMKKNNVLVYFVPMPQPEMYQLDPEITQIIESNGMKWIDAREVCLGEENFSDGYHLGEKGIPKFTKWITEQLLPDLN